MIASWVRTLVGAAVFCALAVTLCPEGRPKRVCRMASACMMAIALLSPVLSLEPETLAEEATRYSRAAQAVTADAEENASLYERRVIECECAAYISDRADALGVDAAGIAVTARWSVDGFWYPWECSVGAAYSDALAGSIEAELGIARERISWEAVE